MKRLSELKSETQLQVFTRREILLKEGTRGGEHDGDRWSTRIFEWGREEVRAETWCVSPYTYLTENVLLIKGVYGNAWTCDYKGQHKNLLV